jgi:hypothetical protein
MDGWMDKHTVSPVRVRFSQVLYITEYSPVSVVVECRSEPNTNVTRFLQSHRLLSYQGRRSADLAFIDERFLM